MTNNKAEFSRLFGALAPQSRAALYFSLRLNALLGNLATAPSAENADDAPAPAPSLLTKRAKEALRRRLVVALWDPQLKAELVDRVVDLRDRGAISDEEIEAAVRLAKQETELYERTNGARGVASKWRSFASSVRGWYERTGASWSPCLGASEPRPPKRALTTGYVITTQSGEILNNEELLS